MKEKINKRLIIFIVIELIFLTSVLFFTKVENYTTTYFILLIAPFLLIVWAGALEVYRERKNPHLLLLSIIIYVIIALNSYLIIDENTIWNGFFSSPTSIINDEGVNDFVYKVTLGQLLILSVLYEVTIFFTRKTR